MYKRITKEIRAYFQADTVDTVYSDSISQYSMGRRI